MPVRAVCKPHFADLKKRRSTSCAGIPGSRPARCDGADPGCYIDAVTRTGVRFRGVSVTDVCQ